MFKKFEDIAVGDSHDLVKTITEADVRKMERLADAQERRIRRSIAAVG